MKGRMAKYGDMAAAGAGVAMKATMVTCMVCIGLGQGDQPLLGYCIGAKNRERYISAFSRNALFFPVWVLTGFACYAAILQENPGQSTPFFASVAILAVFVLPLAIASVRMFVLVMVGLRD